MTGTVSSGRIEVCNSAGCLELGQGQSYFLLDEITKPVFAERAAFLAPPQPGNASTVDTPVRGEVSGIVHDGDHPGRGWGAGGDHPGRGWGAGGNPSANNEGIGHRIIGGTAPGVDTPVRDGVSGIVHDGNNPGRGWGAGGNPLHGPPQ